MNLKRIVFTGILYCASLVLPQDTINSNQNVDRSVMKQTKKVIIFDIGNVLLKPSSQKQILLVLALAVKNPAIIPALLQKNIQKKLFDLLHRVSAQTTSDQCMYNNGEKMPQIMVDWLIGRPYQEVYACAQNCLLQQTQFSASEKMLLQKLLKIVFFPNQLAYLMQPIAPMLELVQKLKKQGYELYILSNFDKASFDLIKKKHDTLFDLFNGIVISGTEGMGKPNPHFYQKLLQTHNLDPQQCIFIDDELHNVQAAQELGITSIHHTSCQITCDTLQNMGILK